MNILEYQIFQNRIQNYLVPKIGTDIVLILIIIMNLSINRQLRV